MEYLIKLSEFFNIIEPWLVFFTFIFHVIIFFMLFKKQLKRDTLTLDIVNIGLEKFKNFIKSEGEKQSKQKNKKPLDISPQIEKKDK